MVAGKLASRLRRSAALIGAVVLAGVTLAACDGSDEAVPRADVGTQRSAIAGYFGAHATWFQTVQGRLDVRLSAPSTRVTDPTSARPVDAPRGGRFLGVELEQGPRSDVPAIRTAPFPSLTLDLVADGRSYPIDLDQLTVDSAAEAEDGVLPFGAATIAIAGPGSRLSLNLTQSGARQTVDVVTGARVTGAAAPLYVPDTRMSGTHSCGPAAYRAPFTGDGPNVCSIAYRRASWVAGLGFAGAGRSWLLAHVDTGAATSVGLRGRPRDTVTLDAESTVGVSIGNETARRVGLGGLAPRAPDRFTGTEYAVFTVPAAGDANVDLVVTKRSTVEYVSVDATPPVGATEGSPVTVTWRTRIH